LTNTYGLNLEPLNSHVSMWSWHRHALWPLTSACGPGTGMPCGLSRATCHGIHLCGWQVLFVNGDNDPFSWGSVTHNTTEQLERDVVALVVRGGSVTHGHFRSNRLQILLGQARQRTFTRMFDPLLACSTLYSHVRPSPNFGISVCMVLFCVCTHLHAPVWRRHGMHGPLLRRLCGSLVRSRWSSDAS
jgi:hypothetical protein